MFKTLVILDLNGLLIDRCYNLNEHCFDDNRIVFKNFCMWVRPGTEHFINMLLEHFDVGIWSSCNNYNIQNIVKYIFKNKHHRLKFIWGCNTRNKNKIKNLNKVWEHFPEYNKNNTYIIDNDFYKIKNNPRECICHVETWTKDKNDPFTLNKGIMSFFANKILFPKQETHSTDEKLLEMIDN